MRVAADVFVHGDVVEAEASRQHGLTGIKDAPLVQRVAVEGHVDAQARELVALGDVNVAPFRRHHGRAKFVYVPGEGFQQLQQPPPRRLEVWGHVEVAQSLVEEALGLALTGQGASLHSHGATVRQRPQHEARVAAAVRPDLSDLLGVLALHEQAVLCVDLFVVPRRAVLRGHAEGGEAQHAAAAAVVLYAALGVLLAGAERLHRRVADDLEVQRIIDEAQRQRHLLHRRQLTDRAGAGSQPPERNAEALHDLEDHAEEPVHIVEATDASVTHAHHTRDVVVEYHNARAERIVTADGLLRRGLSKAGRQHDAHARVRLGVGREVFLRLHEDRRGLFK